MAITNTSKSKEFIAGSSPIILKGDYRPSQKFMADGGRAQYGLGSLVKSIGKAVKGVVRGVKDNPLLAAAALNFAPM